MARRKSALLTDGELRLMQVLWDKGQATVGEVVDALPDPKPPAYNTVLTLLRILERKGYVTHEKDGRAFIYSPRLGRDDARRTAVTHLLRRFFDDSPSLLVLNLIELHKVEPQELRRLKALIATNGE